MMKFAVALCVYPMIASAQADLETTAEEPMMCTMEICPQGEWYVKDA